MIPSMKFKISKRMALAVALLCFAVFGSSQFSSARIEPAQRGEFMVVNKTNYTFVQLFLSPSSRRAWGPDQLGRKVIAPGGSYTLHGIPCGLYDVRLVDSDRDSCVVTEIPMCQDHTHWEVTNDRLARCEGYQ